MESKHEKGAKQNAVSGPRGDAGVAPTEVRLYRGDSQCGWRLFAGPLDPVRYRCCRHPAGHQGAHEPTIGDIGAGEMWWEGAPIRGATLAAAEASSAAAAPTLVFSSVGGGWRLELHRGSSSARYVGEASRPGRDGFGGVTLLVRGSDPVEVMDALRRDVQGFEAAIGREGGR